tara:strand:- start:9 stop:215 length:207 start_codon:yes stop_codon:yes gene_type:complete
MSRKSLLILPFIFSILISSCSSESSKEIKLPALFDSKEAAEEAAKKFNCSGSHKMGEKWMPCEKHMKH